MQRAAAQIWTKRFPTSSSVLSAPDAPVGISLCNTHAFAGGTRVFDYSPPLQQFQVVMHAFGNGDVDDQLLWPYSADADKDAFATAMAGFSDGDYGAVFLTGATTDYSGRLRPATIMVDNTYDGGSLKLCWSRIEDFGDMDVDVVPVAIAIHTTGTPQVVDYVAIVSRVGTTGAAINVYSAGNGAAAMPTREFKNLTGSTAVTPIGVSLVNTAYGSLPGVGVIAGGTTVDSSTTRMTLWGYQVNAITGGPSAGAALGNCPYHIARLGSPPENHVAMAMTQGVPDNIVHQVVAITGSCDDGGDLNWVTDVVKVVDDSTGTNDFAPFWTTTEYLDFSGGIDVPTAITLYGVSPSDETDELRGNGRVGIAGTTKTGSTSTTDVLVAGYYLDDQGASAQKEWDDDENNGATGYSSNDVPTAMVFADLGGTIDERLYITGWTQKTVSSVANVDVLGMCFDARTGGLVLPANRHRWTRAYFRSGADGTDVGIGVIARSVIVDEDPESALYFTSTTEEYNYATDWWQIRDNPFP